MTRITGPATLPRLVAILAFALALPGCGGGTSSTSSSPAAATLTRPASTPLAYREPVTPSPSNFSVAQSAGSVTITVKRTGASATPITIDYDAANETAVAGTDFTATS